MTDHQGVQKYPPRQQGYGGNTLIADRNEIPSDHEARARAALHDLGLELADRWASGFANRPTQQLVLQKIIDPAVKHILSSIFPWVIGMAILFLILLVCTVVTTVIVLRSGSSTPSNTDLLRAAVAAAGMSV